MKSKVYFKRLRDGEANEAINNAFHDLIKKIPLLDIVKKDDFTGIKIHFGEEHNEGHIKSDWIKPLIEALHKKTKRLFLTDSNVIYKTGLRWNSIGHLEIASAHGYDIAKLGIPVIIADGVMGRSYREVAIHKKHFRNIKIAADYLDIDALVCCSHVTGHMFTSIAASIKNIGMGCASRAGKLEQHSNTVPEVTTKECTGCALCEKCCPENAIILKDNKAFIDVGKCIGCGECTVVCRFDAIKIKWSEKIENLQEKMVEYAYGIMKTFEEKIVFFNFLVTITKDCDCLQKKVKKIVPDIGMLASRDPVAIDKASFDLVLKAAGTNKFKQGYPNIDWAPQFRYAEEIGLGSTQYELIEVE